MTKRILALAAAASIAAAIAAAAPASAAIVVGQSIAGVRIGDSPAAVRAKLGTPVRTVNGSNDFGRYTEMRYLRLTVTLQGRRSVTAINTSRSSQRTSTGVGVGSSESALRAGLRGERCSTFSGFRSCVVGRETAGQRVTAFALRRGVVTRVTVGIVID